MSKGKERTKGLTPADKKMRSENREKLKVSIRSAIEDSVTKRGVYAKEIIQVLLEIATELNADSLQIDYVNFRYEDEVKDE